MDAGGEAEGERPRVRGVTVREKYRIVQPETWPINTAEAREKLFCFVAAGMDEEDLPAFADALDRYLAGVLIGLANAFENLGNGATALTGPMWYGEGFKDAMRHIEEIGWAMDPN